MPFLPSGTATKGLQNMAKTVDFYEVTKDDLWDLYVLTLKLPKIAGGVPSNPKIIEAWQRANWPTNEAKLEPGDPKTPEEAAAKTVEKLGPEAPGWNTFLRDAEGHFAFSGYQVKAMFKEAAAVLRLMLLAQQKDAIPLYIRARLEEKVHVEEDLVTFLPHKDQPDASPEKPIHVMTAMGPRDAIKKTDILHDVELTCTLKVLRDGEFPEPLLKTLLNFACDNGLGADRSQGMGKFDYTLKRKS